MSTHLWYLPRMDAMQCAVKQRPKRPGPVFVILSTLSARRVRAKAANIRSLATPYSPNVERKIVELQRLVHLNASVKTHSQQTRGALLYRCKHPKQPRQSASTKGCAGLCSTSQGVLQFWVASRHTHTHARRHAGTHTHTLTHSHKKEERRREDAGHRH